MSSSTSKKRRRETAKKKKGTSSSSAAAMSDSIGWKSRAHNPSAFPGALPIDNQSVGKLRKHVHPHLQSFNFFLDEGLEAMIADLPEYEIDLPHDNKLTLWVDGVTVAPAMKKSNDTDNRLFPAECRERQIYYASNLTVRFGYSINNSMDPNTMTRVYSGFPIMVGSNMCHLNGMSPEQLVGKKEEAHEFGGTFICNGIERVIRMLQVPRRNHPMAIERSAFSKKGPLFTTKGCTIRCGRPDVTSITLTLHYLNDGSVTVRFMMEKAEYFIPFVMLLKAIRESTDREIYERAVGASSSGTVAGNGAGNSGVSQDLVDRQFIADRVELMLHDNKKLNLRTKSDHLSYIGSRFRIKLRGLFGDRTDAEYGKHLLDRFILVHIDGEDTEGKFSLLLLMLRKLYSFASGTCCNDNPDSAMNQELLLPGHLYGMIIKERLEETLRGLDAQIARDVRAMERPSNNGRLGRDVTMSTLLEGDITYMNRILSRQVDIGQKMQYFMATGNLVSSSGMDLMQATGFTVVAEKLNWLRYLAHFRCVHRGAFFSTMKTTTVRKILPENWGFICPVHSPDGAPCGLLQHITATNCPVTHQEPVKTLLVVNLLLRLGCRSANVHDVVIDYGCWLPILLDGRIIAWMPEEKGPAIVNILRKTKVLGTPDGDSDDEDEDEDENENRILPASTEIAYFPPMRSTSTESGGPFPGIYLATAPARMLRPVTNLSLGRRELVGPMEQVFMNIACTPDDVVGFENAVDYKGEDTDPKKMKQQDDVLLSSGVTHMEEDPMNMLSLIASLTPFSDFNQSPRNMYQCQMGKQTMGTPAMALVHRTDNKMYRIQTPQAPIVQNRNQKEYKMDEYPNGTNAIVCVITYTGYDMEDAMIINKSSMERGFAHATVYKTKTIDLKNGKGGTPTDIFHNSKKKRIVLEEEHEKDETEEGGEKEEEGEKGELEQNGNISPSRSNFTSSKQHQTKYVRVEETLDRDGLPYVGLHLSKGTPMYVTQDEITRQHLVHYYKDTEPAIVDEIRYVDDGKVSIRLRYNRNPMVGDKFATRSGQKGVCSILWPARDMPFTESGMVPDILFNPHGFPSRMTIGMQIEAMAGKAGAMHGTFQDSTPFRFHEKQRAVDYFGEQLRAAGYNYYGNEPLYSGLSGMEIHADIFIGNIYYQRLRHMVSDKSQVRSTGAINSLTRQPIKGRKVGGGIRFGEMERDSLLAHGTSFLLQDRLFKCSDEHEAHVCRRCGSILAPHATKPNQVGGKFFYYFLFAS
jgi:DNA-directed RNA polymerase I subunit RPA2